MWGFRGQRPSRVDVAPAVTLTVVSQVEIWSPGLVPGVGEWTVKTHVASILRKLALRDRAQVVVAAYESRLVAPKE